MLCPKCGHEMGEGKMYCEHCGEEIHIVPDFEPEIDKKISSVLNNVADEIDPSRVKLRMTDEPEESDELYHDQVSYPDDVIVIPKKLFIGSMVVIVALLLLLCTVFAYGFYQDNSYTYQLSKGEKLCNSGKYDEAVAYFETAYKMDSDELEPLFDIAKCYEALENTDKTLDIYLLIVSKDPSNEEAFSKIVDIFLGLEDYDELSSTLTEYASEDIRLKYVEYIAKEPGFSLDDGTYDNAVELSLIPSTEGSIYYTLDGSEPGSDCELYTEPITLRKGEYTVKAIFVNEYGICSETVTHNYDIESGLPDDPVISLEGGEYDKPQTVTVTASDGTVYYTVDGSDPNRYSLIYASPISIPMGVTTYKFVVIDDNGQESNVVTRRYNLNVAVSISEQQALDICVNRQIELGRILDANGSVEGAFGRMMYKLTDLREIEGKTVYFILEYYQEGNVFTNMDTMFAIDAYDGTVYHAIDDNNGSYTLELF